MWINVLLSHWTKIKKKKYASIIVFLFKFFHYLLILIYCIVVDAKMCTHNSLDFFMLTYPLCLYLTAIVIVVVVQVLPETHVYWTGVWHAPGTRVLHGRQLRIGYSWWHIRCRTETWCRLGGKPLESLQRVRVRKRFIMNFDRHSHIRHDTTTYYIII